MQFLQSLSRKYKTAERPSECNRWIYPLLKLAGLRYSIITSHNQPVSMPFPVVSLNFLVQASSGSGPNAGTADDDDEFGGFGGFDSGKSAAPATAAASSTGGGAFGAFAAPASTGFQVGVLSIEQGICVGITFDCR